MLNKHSLLKIKVFRSNHELYVSKASRKAIMKISYLVKLNFKAKKKRKTIDSLKKYEKDFLVDYIKGITKIFQYIRFQQNHS